MRCARAQKYGGVIFMDKGTALFDAVAITDIEAERVRAGRRGDGARWSGCWRTGCGAHCGGHGCVGFAQDGGVVDMGDGALTFKGGTISSTKAVRARAR